MKCIAPLISLLLASAAFAQNPPSPGFYFDAQLLWFDSPVREERFTDDTDEGGLVEFAPRFVLGYDDTVGARVRWWTFDRSTTITNPAVLVDKLRFEFDVVDVEATTHLRYGPSDFLLSGGARIASIEINEHWIVQDVFRGTGTTMGGLTLAGEGRTSIYATDCWGTAFVYGGRLSLLKADWHGDASNTTQFDFDLNVRDERFIVPEVFTGVEFHYERAFTRLTVEMQDWKGSVNGTDSHSYGFTGFGLDIGYVF